MQLACEAGVDKSSMNRIFKKYKKRKFNYFDNVVNIYQRILNKIT